MRNGFVVPVVGLSLAAAATLALAVLQTADGGGFPVLHWAGFLVVCGVLVTTLRQSRRDR